MSEDALRAGPRPTQPTTTTTTTSHEFSNLSDTASQQTPVTPKSYHSTRSSFKKLPPPSLTTTCIYDPASSLDSSQSSLNPNNNTNDIPSVIVSPRVAIIDMPEVESTYIDSNVLVKEPILIRGAGNLTIFGVCNKFNEQFPTALNAKLAPEEFRDTIKQINSILNKELENSFKWLVFGSIFCCCTLGCSLLPVIYMNKKAKLCINKLLDMENQRLYNKLGLKWRLAKLKCNSNSLLEYVLLVEFLPTLLLYQPD